MSHCCILITCAVVLGDGQKVVLGVPPVSVDAGAGEEAKSAAMADAVDAGMAMESTAGADDEEENDDDEEERV